MHGPTRLLVYDMMAIASNPSVADYSKRPSRHNPAPARNSLAVLANDFAVFSR